MVEKYYSFVPKISEEEFCTNHSRTKLKIEDFKEWISLYNDSNNKPIKTEPKLFKNKLKSELNLNKILKIGKLEEIEKLI